MRLFLVGATGSPYFEHCKQEMLDFLGPAEKVGLISAANLYDEEAYFRGIEERVTGAAPEIRRELIHIRWNSNWYDALARIDAVIIPGGNTYALLQRLSLSGLLDALREQIQNGLPYIGSSAGANIAGPNILTTNDWNVVGLTHFQSLNLVPFNINPHYIEGIASNAPNSETRDVRIREYHKFWSNPVVGIEETAVVTVVDRQTKVIGKGRAIVFEPGCRQRWFEPGEDVSFENLVKLLQKHTEREGASVATRETKSFSTGTSG